MEAKKTAEVLRRKGRSWGPTGARLLWLGPQFKSGETVLSVLIIVTIQILRTVAIYGGGGRAGCAVDAVMACAVNVARYLEHPGHPPGGRGWGSQGVGRNGACCVGPNGSHPGKQNRVLDAQQLGQRRADCPLHVAKDRVPVPARSPGSTSVWSRKTIVRVNIRKYHPNTKPDKQLGWKIPR